MVAGLLILHGLWLTTAQAQADYSTPYAFITLAGQARSAGKADGTGSAARFHEPLGVAVDSAGNVYVADNETIRKIDPGSVVTTLAGLASDTGSADGTGSTARFYGPCGVAVNGAGDVYVADTFNHTIRKISLGGEVTTVAGLAGSSGSADGTGRAARFNRPFAVAADAAGNVYVADSDNGTIRKISLGGEVTTLAGSAGSFGSADGAGHAARFNSPFGVAVDAAGNVYVAESDNSTIRKISLGGEVTTLAGLAGSFGSADGIGSAARFYSPKGIAVDNASNVYVADLSNSTIRKITPDGRVSTLAGQAGNSGSSDGTGPAARFNTPFGVAVDGAGNLYVADTYNYTIRKGWRPWPRIITGPANQTVLAGTEVALSITAEGAGPVSYQWQHNGRDIAGATSAILRLTQATPDDAGTYRVVVSDGLGTATSLVAQLNVLPLLITLQPQSQSVLEGTQVMFSVVASAGSRLTYQWYFQEAALAGATNSVLAWSTVTAAQAGSYFVTLSSTWGMVTSRVARLIVGYPLDEWTRRDAGTVSGLTDVAYGNGFFVAVGFSTILTSAEGVVWTSRSFTTKNLTRVLYGNTTFAAVEFGRPQMPSVVLSSHDGFNWTSQSWGGYGIQTVGDPNRPNYFPFDRRSHGIGFANGLFALMGIEFANSTASGPPTNAYWRTFGTSPDLINWTNHDLPLTDVTHDILYGLAYGNNQWVAVGLGGAIKTSADAKKWTGRPSGVAAILRQIAHGNETFVAVGDAGTILTSLDGITWSRANAGTSDGLAALVFGNDLFLTVGDNGAVLSSPDGITWTRHASGTTQRLGGVAYGKDSFVAVGENGTILQSGFLVSTPPSITTQPHDQIVLIGANVTLSVGAVSSGPLGYQWQFNSRDLTGATSNTLTLTNVTLNQSGAYAAVVRNALGTVTSAVAQLTVQPSVITAPPQSQTVFIGADVSFKVAAVGASPLSYQWQYNGADLLGATNDSLVLSNVTLSQSGAYAVTIRNPLGTVTSDPAQLTVRAQPVTITVQPQSQAVLTGDYVVFSVVATGTPPLSYQWRYNGSDLPGETNQTLRLASVALTHAGSYAVVVTNQAGGVISTTARLEVRVPEPLDHWTLRPAGTASTLRAVAYGNDQFVTVGNAGTILTSSDGNNWTNRPSGASGTLWEVVFGNQRFVVVGDGGTLLSSPDGIMWARWNLGTSLFGAAFANGTFLVVGGPREQTYPYISDIALTSSDGLTWTGRDPGTRASIDVFGGTKEDSWLTGLLGGDRLFLETVSLFYATHGFNGVRKFIQTSSNGINWTSNTTGNPDEFLGLAYGNSSFVAVGLAGAIQITPNGLSWQTCRSGITSALWDVAFGNGAFVAVGDAGAVVTSPDGIAWTQRRSGTSDGLYGITAGGNTFVAVGKGGTILQSAPLTSTLAPPVLSGRFNDGSFELRIAGTAGRSVSLQSANDLAGNIPWQTLMTLALTNSPAVWRDPPATNRPQRFYRAIAMP